jgi:hypothetical protein
MPVGKRGKTVDSGVVWESRGEWRKHSVPYDKTVVFTRETIVY